MLRATGKSQPVSSFYRAGTQDSRDGEAGQPGTLASGSQSSALLHLHKSEGILPSPSRAYAVSGEVAGVLGEELLRGFPWREKSRGGWGGFLTPSPAPTHIQKHSGRNFISECPFSRELTVSQETSGGDTPSCQLPWQPLGGCGSLFCLEQPQRGSHVICINRKWCPGLQVLRMEQVNQGWVGSQARS